MKKILASLLALAMLFAFTACNPDSTQKTPGEELKDMFVDYTSGLKVNEDGSGVILGQVVDGTSHYGVSTWIGETDKLIDFDDKPVTVSFQLDLSSMKTNDYTTFSLAYGDHAWSIGEETSGWGFEYNTETIFSVLRTANGFIIGQVNNVNYDDDNANRERVISSDNLYGEITDEDGIIDFSYIASYDGENGLSVSLNVNGEKAFDFTINAGASSAINGVGYLWNCVSNIDTVEMLSLSKN